MLFNSYIFILVFLPAALLGFFGLVRFKRWELAGLFVTGLSLWFCAYFDPYFALILTGSILINHLFVRLMDRYGEHRKAFLVTGIIFNVLLLFCFKYIDFTIGTVNVLTGSSIPLSGIVMPLGISFYTFQQIAYLVDYHNGEVRDHSLRKYFFFVSFFPKLASGPIVRHSELMPQLSDRSRLCFDHAYFSKGIYRFSVGLAKKVLLADTLSKAVDHGYSAIGTLSSAESWLVALLYSLQLYFDFSGYCDMALGIANCFHLDLPENFNLPYFADSITDFWKRWHITLTGFLTRYVYIPLGGNRKGKLRTFVNILIVYLISGLWHGADWSFVMWGVLHGAACCLHRLWGGLWNRLPAFIKIPVTFIYVTICWVFFRAKDLGDAFLLLGRMFGRIHGGISSGLTECFDILELTYLEDHIGLFGSICQRGPSLNMIVIILAAVSAVVIEKLFSGKEFRPTAGRAVIAVILLSWSVLSLSGVSVFLYFNF